MYLLNTAHTNTKPPWLSQKTRVWSAECYCTAAVPLLLLGCVPWLRGCSWNPEEVWIYIALAPEQHLIDCTSLDYVFGPTSKYLLFPRSTGNKHGTNTHAHRQMHRPWPSQREEFHVRLLLYRGCHKVDSLRAWGTMWWRHDTAAAAEQKAKLLACGVPLSREAQRGGMRSAEYLPDRATLNAQSTRHAVRPEPTLASQLRAREWPAAKREKRGHVQKNMLYHTYTCIHIALVQQSNTGINRLQAALTGSINIHSHLAKVKVLRTNNKLFP